LNVKYENEYKNELGLRPTTEQQCQEIFSPSLSSLFLCFTLSSFPDHVFISAKAKARHPNDQSLIVGQAPIKRCQKMCHLDWQEAPTLAMSLAMEEVVVDHRKQVGLFIQVQSRSIAKIAGRFTNGSMGSTAG